MSGQPIYWRDTRGIGLWRMFVTFLAIGVMGFGGVLALCRYELVDRRRWLTGREFTEILSLCQFLPGPNIANMTVVFGMRVAGIRGAIVAFLGLMVMPVTIVLFLAVLYREFSGHEEVRAAFRGIASAAAGLLVALAAKTAWPLVKSPRVLIVGGVVLAAIIVFRFPLLWVVAVAGPISLLLAGRGRDGRS
mgnify:CR=1 FL=1